MVGSAAWRSGLCGALLAAVVSSQGAFAQATLSALATPDPALPGAPVALDVRIADIADLYAYQFTLSFDSALLQATGVTEGAFLPAAGSTYFIPGTIDNALGSISFTVGSLLGALPGQGGNGVLARVSFDVMGVGSSAITFSDVLFLDSGLAELTVQVQNGVLQAVPEPASMLLFGLGLAGLAAWRTRRSA